MGHYTEDDAPPITVSKERVVVGMIYLLLSGGVFIGLVHLLAQG